MTMIIVKRFFFTCRIVMFASCLALFNKSVCPCNNARLYEKLSIALVNFFPRKPFVSSNFGMSLLNSHISV
jgi:hypothetical protein